MIHKWIHSVLREIYANVCMTSFNIDMEALWSAVGLNKNEFPQRQSQMFSVCCVYILRTTVALCDTKVLFVKGEEMTTCCLWIDFQHISY